MKPNKNAYGTGIFIIGILFFIFGFVTWLNATLIPYLNIACELTEEWQGYLVTFAFYIAYFVMALPSSWVLKKTGYKNGMTLGLLIMAFGALAFIPAALTRTYGLFLLGLFIMGTGLSILQTASNPYVIELGPPESAAQRVSIMGICNKVAGAISPLILGSIMLKNIDQLEDSLQHMTVIERAAALDILASKAIIPYIIIMISFVILGLFVKFSPLPYIDDPEGDCDSLLPEDKCTIFSFPHLWIGVLALFLYVGGEVIAVDSIIRYGTAQGMSMDVARVFPTYSMLAMIVGYIIGIICIPKYISQEKALSYCAVLGLILGCGVIFLPLEISIWCLSLLSLANSLMWPAIFPLAIYGLGRHTKTGSALLIMAIAGGALLPMLYGSLTSICGYQQAYWLVIPCYAVILYFALIGYRIGRVTTIQWSDSVIK